MQYQSRFQRFFSENLCEKAGKCLSSSASAQFLVTVKSGDSEAFFYSRENNTNTIKSGQTPGGADVTFLMSEEAAQALLSLEMESVGRVAVGVLEQIFSEKDSLKIHVKVHIGIFDFLKKGYLSVLTLGGRELATYLAHKKMSTFQALKVAVDLFRA